jgi:hypothetical protein
MSEESKKIVNVARAIYAGLSETKWTRAEVEELAQKVADKIPWEQIGRNLAVPIVAVALKAAEAAGALYEQGSDPIDVTPKPKEDDKGNGEKTPPARPINPPTSEPVKVPEVEVEVLPPGTPRAERTE